MTWMCKKCCYEHANYPDKGKCISGDCDGAVEVTPDYVEPRKPKRRWS